MKNKKSRVLYLMILVAFLLSTVTAFSPSNTVQAGSNGQQIYFSCGSVSPGVAQMDSAVVKGYNQQGQYVMWQGPVYWANDSHTISYFRTNGWWWIGTVRIYWWQARTNRWVSATYTIPKEQWGSDYVYLTCKYYT